MGHVHTTTQVDGPLEAAFEFGANPERVPEWLSMAVEVKAVSGPLDRVGAGYTAVMKIAGRKLDARWEVARVEKPRLLELKGATPGGGTATFTMRYAQVADGTEITRAHSVRQREARHATHIRGRRGRAEPPASPTRRRGVVAMDAVLERRKRG
jgi:hypothetical protein